MLGVRKYDKKLITDITPREIGTPYIFREETTEFTKRLLPRRISAPAVNIFKIIDPYHNK